ncbi:MAG: DUF6734 family protein [Bacteroidota bacterium]
MKIVQSYWSKPATRQDNDRNLGGWRHYKYHLMSWALSSLQLCKFYDRVQLITDTEGKRLLIDELQLPYTEVSLSLDDIQHYNTGLWALGKIQAHSIQKEPFIHVDNDVYIWQSFPQNIHEAGIIVQSIEFETPSVQAVVRQLDGLYKLLPDPYKEVIKTFGKVPSYNAGIVGGNDLEFFAYYCEEVFEFLDAEKDKLLTEHFPVINIIYEQFFMCALTLFEELDVTCLFDRNYLFKIYNELDYERLIKDHGYFHAHHLKKNPTVEKSLEHWLSSLHPIFYERIEQYVTDA